MNRKTGHLAKVVSQSSLDTNYVAPSRIIKKYIQLKEEKKNSLRGNLDPLYSNHELINLNGFHNGTNLTQRSQVSAIGEK